MENKPFRSFMKGDKPARNHKVTEAYTSTGERISQATIDKRYYTAKAKKWGNLMCNGPCEACGQPGNDPDHTISQKRCKELHKAELIYDPRNFPWSCRKCHNQWENFKSGEWLLHSNSAERLAFMKEHDPEGYTIRIELTQHSLTLEAQNDEP